MSDFLDSTAVCALIGRTWITIHRWVRKGKFPRPVKLGNRSMWLRREVDEFIERLKARA